MIELIVKAGMLASRERSVDVAKKVVLIVLAVMADELIVPTTRLPPCMFPGVTMEDWKTPLYAVNVLRTLKLPKTVLKVGTAGTATQGPKDCRVLVKVDGFIGFKGSDKLLIANVPAGIVE